MREQSPHGVGAAELPQVSQKDERPMTQVRKLPSNLAQAFRASDLESERIASIIRAIIFVTLLAAVFTARTQEADHRPLELAVLVYGLGTIAGLVAAWRKYHPVVLPYFLVGFDVITLTIAIVMIGAEFGIAPIDAFTLPISGLLVVVFLHASLRYNPWLVVFAAGVLAAVILAASIVSNVEGSSHHTDAAEHLMHFRVFPIILLILTMGILAVTTARTRRLIANVYVSTSRAATLSRYFSRDVAEELMNRPSETPEFGDRIRAAVLFADMQGFTTMAEAMDPGELARVVSDFRQRISRPVLANGGVVDKYIGDAVMAVFGAPRQAPDDAKRAILCALSMVDEIEAWSRERKKLGKPPIRIAIGGHFGDVFAGVISDGTHLEYTVIGDTVNVASRLARLPRALETPLVISTPLVEAAGCHDVRLVALPPQPLPGHPKPMPVHKLSG